MEKNLKSSEIVYPPGKTGHENVTKEAHKKVVDVAYAPQKEAEKILQDIAKNGIIKDHVKWVKTCVNKEDSTCNYNIVNNEELTSVESSHKPSATCCVIHLTCCEKSDHEKLDNRSKKPKKPKNCVCFGFR